MANPEWQFDPVGEAPGNVPLILSLANGYGVTAFDAPAPEARIQWAGSVDTEGQIPASRGHENRRIDLTVECTSAQALRDLQAKVAKIHRESGTLKYTLPADSEAVTFTLHTAFAYEPKLDHAYFVNNGAFCEVRLSFTAAPYGRGTSYTLPVRTATANGPLIFTETGIKGDMAGWGSLKVNNLTTSKSWLYWGVQSYFYDSATSAGLFFEAEAGTAINATPNPGPSGASGGGTNKVLRHTSVGTSGSLSYGIGPSGNALTHTGTYVAFARVQAHGSNSGVVSLKMAYSTSGPTIDNGWVPVVSEAGAAVKGSWAIVKLGQVYVQKRKRGAQAWFPTISAKSTVAGDGVDFDWITLVPCDEAAGTFRSQLPLVGTTDVVMIEHDDVTIGNLSTDFYSTPKQYEGDYLTVPPAGKENRPLRVVVMLAGNASGNLTEKVVDAVNMEAISGHLTYTPRYLVVPSP